MGRIVRRQVAIEFGEGPAITQVDDGRSDLREAVALADQPRDEGHAASGAVGTLIGVVGVVYEIRHAIGDPLWGGSKIRQRVVADEGGAPARQGFARALATKIS